MNRLVRPAFAVLGGLLALYVLRSLTGAASGGTLDSALYTAVEVGATGLCLARAVRDRGERAAWGLLGGYALLWTLGDLAWTFHFDALANPPMPNWADALYLSSYLLAYAGLGLLVRARVPLFRTSLWLDGLVAGLALAAVSSALLFGPVLHSTGGSPGVIATSFGYVVFDLLLLCVVGMAFGLTGWRLAGGWGLLGWSLILLAVADGLWGYLEAKGAYHAGDPVDTFWPASMLALAGAAWRPREQARALGDGLVLMVTPSVFAFGALALLAFSQVHRIPLVAAALAVAALTAAGVRALLTFRENAELLRRSRDEALTDGLTGLGNRRRLMRDLDEAHAAAQQGRPATLVLFDLDGFKGYNDAFGHPAGDALLAQLAGRLIGAVDGAGTAYRLGGDEFCVLLDGRCELGAPLVTAIAAALTLRRDGYRVGASLGVVALPDDASSATAALQRADELMYADKDRRRGPRALGPARRAA